MIIHPAVVTFIIAIVFSPVIVIGLDLLNVERLSIFTAIYALFQIAITLRVLGILYMGMWKHLILENKDLSRNFKLVSRESKLDNRYYLWVQTIR